MLYWFLSESAGYFWKPEEFENVENPDPENLKHLQNLGHFFLAKGYICTLLDSHKTQNVYTSD